MTWLHRLKGMRMRLGALAPVSLIAVSLLTAACGISTSQVAAPAAASPAPSVATSSASGQQTSGPVSEAGGGTSASASPAGSCAATKPETTVQSTALTGLQFVSAAQGWAVGQNAILTTADGGAHWRTQLSGSLNLTSVDFVSARVGWAVGASRLLATTDGGAHWTALPEPCPVIRSVHFISAEVGYAVAGGTGPQYVQAGPVIPDEGGIVLVTQDGGRDWSPLSHAPGNNQTVCFSNARDGYLGANGFLYRTTNGGQSWTKLTGDGGQLGPGTSSGEMSVECAAGGTAWAVRIGPDAGMSQEEHVAYYASLTKVTALYAEGYWESPGATPTAQSPSSDPGPFSAISASSAVFVDFCEACGWGTAPYDLVTGSGATLTKEGMVGQLNDPAGASFVSAESGWVTGSVTQNNAKNQDRWQERIVGTRDGGRTWRVEYATPWSKWT